VLEVVAQERKGLIKLRQILLVLAEMAWQLQSLDLQLLTAVVVAQEVAEYQEKEQEHPVERAAAGQEEPKRHPQVGQRVRQILVEAEAVGQQIVAAQQMEAQADLVLSF
jgi:hypothetical protein